MAYPDRRQSDEALWHPEHKRLYDGRTTWLAPEDLKTTETVTLAPQSTTVVTLDLPRKLMTPYITPGPARRIFSARSILAQLGAAPPFEVADELATAASQGHDTYRIGIHNHGNDAIEITKGTGIGRLGRWSEEIATGHELEALVSSNIVKLEGEKGRDWDYYRDPRTDMLSGLYMRLDPSMRRHLPGDSERKIVITPDTKGKESRKQIDRWIKSIEEDPTVDEPTIEISETLASLYLPPTIHGLIDPLLTHIPGNRFHINSPLIIGGETGIVGTENPWHIRTEIQRPDDGSPQPDAIVITLSKPLQTA